jgi:cob(I)alamin adenosyltransferase
MMRIYTKTGDSGQTSLYSGERVAKDDARISACGDLDELNAFLGVAVQRVSVAGTRSFLARLQNSLFNLGAELATTDGRLETTLDAAEIRRMEDAIDVMDGQMAELRTFILPGGTEGAIWLHVCRAVCRRAERSVVRVTADAPVTPLALTLLNRLSDLLFVMARFENFSAGISDVTWVKHTGEG